eukprot:405641-Pelagomonas_calceolata.AAC.2
MKVLCLTQRERTMVLCLAQGQNKGPLSYPEGQNKGPPSCRGTDRAHSITGPACCRPAQHGAGRQEKKAANCNQLLHTLRAIESLVLRQVHKLLHRAHHPALHAQAAKSYAPSVPCSPCCSGRHAGLCWGSACPLSAAHPGMTTTHLACHTILAAQAGTQACAGAMHAPHCYTLRVTATHLARHPVLAAQARAQACAGAMHAPCCKRRG